MAQDSSRRGMGNNSIRPGFATIQRFILVNGIPWFIGFCEATADIENDNPGGRVDRQIGIVISPVGPGTVKYTVNAPGGGTPKRISIEIPTAAKNYVNSEAWQKHRFRFQIAGGGWSDWRCGVQELSNLDSVVDSHAAWGAFTSGQSLEIEHEVSSGWPYANDSLVIRNPGEVGDPSLAGIGTSDAAPPREVVAKLWYEASALSGLGTFRNEPGSTTAAELVTTIESVEEV